MADQKDGQPTATKMKKNIAMGDPFRGKFQVEMASFTSRFVAEMIDYSLLLVIDIFWYNLYTLAVVSNDSPIYVSRWGDKHNIFIVDKKFFTTTVTFNLWPVYRAELARILYITVFESAFIYYYKATPGKIFLGLKVTFCSTSTCTDARGYIFINPDYEVPYWQVFYRTILKNYLNEFVFVLMFSAYFNRFQRNYYDTLGHSIVIVHAEPDVEEPITFKKEEAT